MSVSVYTSVYMVWKQTHSLFPICYLGPPLIAFIHTYIQTYIHTYILTYTTYILTYIYIHFMHTNIHSCTTHTHTHTLHTSIHTYIYTFTTYRQPYTTYIHTYTTHIHAYSKLETSAKYQQGSGCTHQILFLTPRCRGGWRNKNPPNSFNLAFLICKGNGKRAEKVSVGCL